MLDQNTDRMWYVIGAVIVGAALIFLMNSSMPTLFAAVSDTFRESAEETLGFIDREFTDNENVSYGESRQEGIPTFEKSSAIRHKTSIELNGATVALDVPLRGIGSVRDQLYLDKKDNMWKITRRFNEIVVTDQDEWKKEHGHWYISIEDVNRHTNNIMVSHSTVTDGVFAESHLPASDDDNETAGIRFGNNKMGGSHNINLLFFNPVHQSMDEWKVWVSKNPMTVVYQLDEPVVETVSANMQNVLNKTME